MFENYVIYWVSPVFLISLLAFSDAYFMLSPLIVNM
jgi:hypothetical protein